MITYEDKVALNENTDIANINKVTAGDMNEIKQVVNSLANLFFPIRKVVIFNDNDDHSNYLGFTWERTAVGKVLVGYDNNDTDFNTIGKIGGEKTHTLTIDEMPSHNHDIKYASNDTGFGDNYFTAGKKSSYSTSSIPINNTGGGQSHNNLQPYQVVAYWKRIA